MLLLIGPSASGKTEIAKQLVLNYGFEKCITFTTRPMRKNEKNGVDYHFVTKENFLLLVRQGYFAETTEYNGNFYGTSKISLIGDKVVVLDPDGLENYQKLGIPLVSVSLECSEKERFSRMISRGDSVEAAQSRIENDRRVFGESLKFNTTYHINSEHYSIQELSKIISELYYNKKN